MHWIQPRANSQHSHCALQTMSRYLTVTLCDHMTVRFPSCLICGCKPQLWRKVNGHPIERCRSCRFAYVNPRPDRRAIAEMYRIHGGHGALTVPLEEALEAERRAPNSTIDARNRCEEREA